MLITVIMEGVDTMVARVEVFSTKVEAGSKVLMAKTGEDSLGVMRDATHVRSGKLREGDTLEAGELEFTLSNPVRYAKWVEGGHNTPSGWRTKHGYRPAKHRHWVEARPFLEPAKEFVVEELPTRLAALLDT